MNAIVPTQELAIVEDETTSVFKFMCVIVSFMLFLCCFIPNIVLCYTHT